MANMKSGQGPRARAGVGGPAGGRHIAVGRIRRRLDRLRRRSARRLGQPAHLGAVPIRPADARAERGAQPRDAGDHHRPLRRARDARDAAADRHLPDRGHNVSLIDGPRERHHGAGPRRRRVSRVIRRHGGRSPHGRRHLGRLVALPAGRLRPTTITVTATRRQHRPTPSVGQLLRSSGRLVLKRHRPAGDDNGPGTYPYPTDRRTSTQARSTSPGCRSTRTRPMSTSVTSATCDHVWQRRSAPSCSTCSSAARRWRDLDRRAVPVGATTRSPRRRLERAARGAGIRHAGLGRCRAELAGDARLVADDAARRRRSSFRARRSARPARVGGSLSR